MSPTSYQTAPPRGVEVDNTTLINPGDKGFLDTGGRLAFRGFADKGDGMRKLTALLAAGLLTAMLTGCGDPNDGVTVVDEGSVQEQPGGDSAAVPPGVTLSGEVTSRGEGTATNDEIEIVAKENYFEPTFVKVEPGKTYKVKLRNEGTGFHTFTVGTQDIDIPLPPGQEAETQLVAPATGSVEFVCTPHASMGMRGAAYVP